MEGIYTRQATLGLTIPSEVVVVGCGGTGSWTAIFLAMSGVPKLNLMDEDTVELSNLNRVLLTETSVGRPKAEEIASVIKALRPDAVVVLHGKATDFTLGFVPDTATHLFDCTDMLATQLMLSKWCKSKDKKYIRVGYDGLSITVDEAVPRFTTGKAGEEAGYRTTPSWVVPAAMSALLGVMKAELYPEFKFGGMIYNIAERTALGQPTTRVYQFKRLTGEAERERYRAQLLERFGNPEANDMDECCKLCGKRHGNHYNPSHWGEMCPKEYAAWKKWCQHPNTTEQKLLQFGNAENPSAGHPCIYCGQDWSAHSGCNCT